MQTVPTAGLYCSNEITGNHVARKWANSIAEGVVQYVRPESTAIASKGKTIRRNGTPANAAVVIRHKSGNDVLKLASELQQTVKD